MHLGRFSFNGPATVQDSADPLCLEIVVRFENTLAVDGVRATVEDLLITF